MPRLSTRKTRDCPEDMSLIRDRWRCLCSIPNTILLMYANLICNNAGLGAPVLDVDDAGDVGDVWRVGVFARLGPLLLLLLLLAGEVVGAVVFATPAGLLAAIDCCCFTALSVLLDDTGRFLLTVVALGESVVNGVTFAAPVLETGDGVLRVGERVAGVEPEVTAAAIESGKGAATTRLTLERAIWNRRKARYDKSTATGSCWISPIISTTRSRKCTIICSIVELIQKLRLASWLAI